ncbi:hypothetical protein TNCV_2926371 [Trichonephila clavipes]|nr:hypothetical protein TNCV_2926371 [Trichonephila clavipes]
MGLPFPCIPADSVSGEEPHMRRKRSRARGSRQTRDERKARRKRPRENLVIKKKSGKNDHRELPEASDERQDDENRASERKTNSAWNYRITKFSEREGDRSCYIRYADDNTHPRRPDLADEYLKSEDICHPNIKALTSTTGMGNVLASGLHCRRGDFRRAKSF